VLLHGSNCSLARAMDGCVICCGIVGSYQLAATSKVVKALLVTSMIHVSSAVASTRPLLLPLLIGEYFLLQLCVT